MEYQNELKDVQLEVKERVSTLYKVFEPAPIPSNWGVCEPDWPVQISFVQRCVPPNLLPSHKAPRLA